MLRTIHYHLEELDYDFPLIIVGDTGNGKSMLALHIYEIWTRLFQKKKMDIKDIAVDRFDWLKNFKTLSACDCNVFDEGITGLASKEAVNKFSKNLEKLYQVFRKKRYFTVILIPNFFMLNKTFRDYRARGLIWVDKRGRFKYYTKESIRRLNAYNENRNFKNMRCVRPDFIGIFPDYRGELRADYDAMAQASVDKVYNEVLQEADPDQTHKKESEKVNTMKRMIKEGFTQKEVGLALGLTQGRVSQMVGEHISINN